MQLSPSADLLVPVGVGVLVAVVAVIVLVIGLRRRADDAPVPSHDDWTGEHVGEVVAPKTRTVADAVAARQGNTNPFFLGSPERPGVAGAGGHVAADPGTAAPPRAAEGNGTGTGPALPQSVLGSAVSTAAQRVRARHAVQWAARAMSVARAEFSGVVGRTPTAVSGVRPAAAEGAAPPPATVVTAEARHFRADDDDSPTYPSDPLRGAGRSGEGGGAGFGPLAHQGGSSSPGPAGNRSGGSSDEFPEQRSGTAVPPAPVRGTGQELSRGNRPADDRPEPTPGAALPADDRPAAGEGDSAPTGAGPSAVRPPVWGAAGSAPTGAGPSAVRPPVAGAAGSAPAGLPGGQPVAGGSESAPTGAGPSAVRPPVAGAAGSAPAGLSADGHPVAGGVESAGRSADGHPVAGAGAAGTGSATAGHPAAEGTEPGPATGSSHSVAAAVAQVLAARAAAQAPEGDRRGDARDRLLAVLLDDPLRAVGAAVDLQECQERLDRLTASLKDEHGRLGDVLGRLACSGLRPDQLARLSGLSDVEVAELLRRRKAD